MQTDVVNLLLDALFVFDDAFAPAVLLRPSRDGRKRCVHGDRRLTHGASDRGVVAERAVRPCRLALNRLQQDVLYGGGVL